MLHSQILAKNKGFNVKMRLLHNTRTNKTPTFIQKYFIWFMWLSISLYFFSSFLTTKNKPISKTTFLNIKPTRALIEESSSTSLSKSPNSQLHGMRIYIYDLPPKYNKEWLSNERCKTHLFASEVAIHNALLKSDVRTLDPFEADFFFVPVYVSCNFSKVNGFPAIGHARSLIATAISHVSVHLPFWNRSLGSDHVFVASHDFGSCFHTLEDVAIADGVPKFLKRSIVLQTFGVEYKHPCQDVENVVIPPYVSPGSIQATLEQSPLTGHRDIFAFFRGKMEINPKNVSGRFYGKTIRTMIWRRYGNDRRFYLRRNRFSGYQSEIARSTFCLCPLGWAPWSPRLVESVALGCVPVIIANGIRLPFPSAVPWSNISLTVAEDDVANLGKILSHVAATNLSSIQRNLWDPRVRKALVFYDLVLEGDATWQVLVALAEKLDRSNRKLRVDVR